MPHLVQMAQQHADLGLRIAGVTDASVAQTLAFMSEHQLTFPVLAEAPETRVAFGIDLIWGSPMFLLDEKRVVVAEGHSNVEAFLSDLASDSRIP